MAVATVTLTANNFPGGVDNTQRLTYVRGTARISASPSTYQTGGLALPWITAPGIVSLSGHEVIPKVQGIYVHPIQVTFFSAGGAYYGSSYYAPPSGFLYVWNKDLDTIEILASPGAQSAGTGPVYQEMTNLTAIPAAVSNDFIMFEAVFVRSFG